MEDVHYDMFVRTKDLPLHPPPPLAPPLVPHRNKKNKTSRQTRRRKQKPCRRKRRGQCLGCTRGLSPVDVRHRGASCKIGEQEARRATQSHGWY